MAKRARVLWLAFIAGGLLAVLGCSPQLIEISLSQPPTRELVGQIYIGGAVMSPSLYPIKEGDSLEDLIQAAGGITDDGDLNRIELRIPLQGEAEEPQKIDLNRAPAWLLEALPGIGEVKAQAIISYRAKSGFFKNTSELMKVEGIGHALFDQIKELVTVAD
jgi:competence protein ComEA